MDACWTPPSRPPTHSATAGAAAAASIILLSQRRRRRYTAWRGALRAADACWTPPSGPSKCSATAGAAAAASRQPAGVLDALDNRGSCRMSTSSTACRHLRGCNTPLRKRTCLPHPRRQVVSLHQQPGTCSQPTSLLAAHIPPCNHCTSANFSPAGSDLHSEFEQLSQLVQPVEEHQ